MNGNPAVFYIADDCHFQPGDFALCSLIVIHIQERLRGMFMRAVAALIWLFHSDASKCGARRAVAYNDISGFMASDCGLCR